MWKRISSKVSVVLGIFALILVTAIPGPAFPESPSADISRLAALTELQDNVKNTLAAVVDEKKVLDLLQDQSGVKDLSFNTGRQFTEISVEFGSELLKAMILQKITLTFSTNLGKSIFNPAQTEFGFLGARGLDSPEVRVKLTIGRAPAEQRLLIDRYMQGHGMSGVLDPVVFKTEVLAGEKMVELPASTDYVTYSVILPKEVNPYRAVGVMLSREGQLLPVPTRFLTESGKNLAVLKSRQFGTFTVVERSIDFSDVRKHWAREDINILAAKQIINGVSSDSFAPDREVTRAQAAVMLGRALALAAARNPVQFKDVHEDAWYSAAVSAVVESGILRGYPGGEFRPDALISREELAVLANRVLSLCGEAVNIDSPGVELILGDFTDWNNISSWARPGFAVAVKTGILQGTESGNLNPQAKCTRAEFAVMLRRLMINAGLISPSVILVSPADDFYTNKNNLTVRGKAKPGNTVSICGEKAATALDGTFDTSRKLSLGTNIISLTDEDLSGYKEQLVCKVVYDDTPPILQVNYPNDKLITKETQITVEGYTEQGCSVKINDTEAAVSASGSVTAQIQLEPGRNVLEITATDRAGNETSARRVVYSSPNTISGFTVSPDPIKLGSQVNIRFMLEQDAYVTLEVCREDGERVKKVQDRTFNISGIRNGYWDGKDSSGSLVPDGRYRITGIVTDSSGDELARTEKTVMAARVPQISSELGDLPVFAPGENEVITIPYAVQADALVTIKILKGHSTLKTLAENLNVQSGSHSMVWDGKDSSGSFAADGVYSCVIDAASAEVEKFKVKSEFRFIIEREPPKITDLTVNPDPVKINVLPLNIRYRLSETAKVTVVVQDKYGQVVAVLIKDTMQERGARNITWNGRNSQENYVPEGEYKVVIQAVDTFQKDSGLVTVNFTVGCEPGISEVRLTPSPFYATGSNRATISFILTEEAVVTVEIKVLWVTVKTLMTDSLEKPGLKTIRWDGADQSGYLVGEGRYDIQITAISPTVSSFKTKFSGSFDVKEVNSQKQ